MVWVCCIFSHRSHRCRNNWYPLQKWWCSHCIYSPIWMVFSPHNHGCYHVLLQFLDTHRFDCCHYASMMNRCWCTIDGSSCWSPALHSRASNLCHSNIYHKFVLIRFHVWWSLVIWVWVGWCAAIPSLRELFPIRTLLVPSLKPETLENFKQNALLWYPHNCCVAAPPNSAQRITISAVRISYDNWHR